MARAYFNEQNIGKVLEKCVLDAVTIPDKPKTPLLDELRSRGLGINNAGIHGFGPTDETGYLLKIDNNNPGGFPQISDVVLSESERLALKAENDSVNQQYQLRHQRYEQIAKCTLGYIGYETLKNALSN